jgi:hypothetical protein
VEIHAPHHAVKSWKEALVHLTLITIGVLIALSVEGIATWREHRALVREARANLASEIRDNQKELKNRLANIPKERQNLDRADEAVRTMMAHKELKGEINLSFVTAELRDASHVTAQLTGAFALMDYDEVQKYARVYYLQALYKRLHDSAFENLTKALGFTSLLAQPASATPRELEDFRAQLRATNSALLVEEQIGKSLLTEYEHVLQER